jgi:adenylosuccinate synthase
LPRVLLTYDIKKIPLGYKELIDSDGLIKHFIQDVRTMQDITKLYNFEKLKNKYDYIIFEGAQGLELDENNIIAYPHVTASETTSRVPLQRIKNMNCDTEICYITRSYFTRHGAGAFPTECDKNVINPNIIDETNSYNDYQQIIRYGLFNKNEFKNRIIKDMSNANPLDDVKFSVFISHLNYTNGDLAGDCTIKDISSLFSKIYLSDTKFAEDVKEMFPL